jgi:SAM-dependent methyltransferase
VTEKTLEQELADRVREAVRRATPATFAEPEGPAGPDALRRAERHLTPSIPEGARLAGVKNALVRALRFLWREQAAFNALVLEAFASLRRDFAAYREATERELALSRRRARVQDARFAILEAPNSPRAVAGGTPPTEAAAPIPPAVYSLFEERFRGSPESIAENQRFYLDLLRDAPGPVLDVGCGRGEFLRLLAGAGIAAAGIESNPVSVRLCREAGLSVEEGDARRRLADRPSESLGAVVAFQVVEHWTAGDTFAFLAEARRVLRPGGALVAETVNTDSLSALRAYFLDPTHVRPVPPEALAFLAEAAGFDDVSIVYRSPLPSAERLTESSENDAKLNRLLFAPQDYAVIAKKN